LIELAIRAIDKSTNSGLIREAHPPESTASPYPERPDYTLIIAIFKTKTLDSISALARREARRLCQDHRKGFKSSPFLR
jgi:hypothetical protein